MLTDAQRAYSNSKREMLSLVLELEKYEKILAVDGTKVFAYTDHEALLPLLTARDLPVQFMRWINRIQKFIVLGHHRLCRLFIENNNWL